MECIQISRKMHKGQVLVLQTYLLQLVSSLLIQHLPTFQKTSSGCLLANLSIIVFFAALIAIDSLVTLERRLFFGGIFFFHLFVERFRLSVFSYLKIISGPGSLSVGLMDSASFKGVFKCITISPVTSLRKTEPIFSSLVSISLSLVIESTLSGGSIAISIKLSSSSLQSFISI